LDGGIKGHRRRRRRRRRRRNNTSEFDDLEEVRVLSMEIADHCHFAILRNRYMLQSLQVKEERV